ncbi:T9SS type A sorting domain-containing protein [candidate division WOR-3 bacterium]|nr:T9SS type A sorting domain-containing protein [candidate division WOR-3 bacterium]
MRKLLVIGFLFIAISIYANPPEADWTILVYLDGDNNLEECGIMDMNEMEFGVDTSLYNVIVQFDRCPGYDTSNGNWTNTRRYRVTPDSDPLIIHSELIEDMAEQNMGNRNTLVDFVTWGADNYPAEHYALILWDHGDGFYKKDITLKSICYDETDNDVIGIVSGEFGRALWDIRDSLGKNLDLIAYDACLMGMIEVDYVAKDYVDVTVHSEHIESGLGYPYTDILNWLNSHPDATPQAFGSAIAEKYIDSYLPGGSQHSYYCSATQSAIDLNPDFNRLMVKFDDFVRELIKSGGVSNSDILDARDSCQYYYFIDYVDLYSFADEIDKRNINASLDSVAKTLKDEFNYFLLYEGHYTAPYDSFPPFPNTLDESYGLSIYFPLDMYIYPLYKDLVFARQNPWWAFINGATSLPTDELILGFDSHSGGDTIEVGTKENFYITLRNSSGITATQVQGALFTSDPYVSNITPDTVFYPNIPSEGTTQSFSPFTFDISNSTPNGHRITFILDVEAEPGYYMNSISFNMIVKNTIGVEERTEIRSQKSEVRLFQNKPNPFSQKTVISYSSLVINDQLPMTNNGQHAVLCIYDLSGRLIRQFNHLTNRPFNQITWDGKDDKGNKVPAGIYFYRLQIDNFTSSKKMIIVR